MKKVQTPPRMHTHPPPKRNADPCRLLALPPSHCCSVVEAIGEGVITIDLGKKITYLNPAAESLTGFTAQEAVGQQCFDVLRGDACEERCPFDAIRLHRKERSMEKVFILNKVGKQLPVAISLSPLNDEEGSVIGAVETFRDLSELEELRKQAGRTYTDEDIVGRHPRMKEILSILPDIAESESAVLIEGPTGSGKELIARAIHNLSPRRTGPFVAVNCAALPETLLESELFGYAKGAFTGAMKNKPGRLSLANRGTLFLDEISSTSVAFQSDLLRVLEDGEKSCQKGKLQGGSLLPAQRRKDQIAWFAAKERRYSAPGRAFHPKVQPSERPGRPGGHARGSFLSSHLPLSRQHSRA